MAATAIALLGFSMSRSYWMLCFWAIPYGLGAGSVDASLNNYVALHYASRHMSWLHCMWGVGAATGPYIMGFALSSGQNWNAGYLYVAVLQVILCITLLFSMGRWKCSALQGQKGRKPLPLKRVFTIPGAREVMLAFLCYCAVEQTAGMWASSYFVMKDGVSPQEAANLASLYYIGLTAGRFFSGFLTMRFDDTTMIRMGQGVMLAGIVVMLLPLGCAPIYPCIIHSTPRHFGEENSQAVIGVQMASAYLGCLTMPSVFGLIANHISMSLLPVFLALLLGLMVLAYERLERITR